MRYNINSRFIYDVSDGTLTLQDSSEPDCRLSITANILLHFFLRNPGIISREEVLKAVWEDSGFTSSSSNLNQYLSMLRKTFRHYGIDNIIVSVSRGYLQLNPDISIEVIEDISTLDPEPDIPPIPALIITPEPSPAEKTSLLTPHVQDMCWYMAGLGMLVTSILLTTFSLANLSGTKSITLSQIAHSQCELLASADMLHSVTTSTYNKNFDNVRTRLNIPCRRDELFIFFYGDRLETNGLGRVFLAHCAIHEDNPFSYCDNYFYYSWKP